MLKIRNYCIGFSIAICGTAFGQGVSAIGFQNQQVQLVSHTSQSNPSFDNLSEQGSSVKSLSKEEILHLNLEELTKDPVLKNANWGFVIYDPKTKEIISSYNEKAPLIPASTTKLLTTETALNLLGADYRWTTQVEYSGNIDENGVLTGDLYVIGSGDPSLGTNKAGASSYAVLTDDIVYAIKEKGIKKVNGNVIMQTAVFKGNKIQNLPANIVWQDFKDYYLPVGNTSSVEPREEKIATSSSFKNAGSRYFYMSPYTQKLVYTDTYNASGISTKIAAAPAYLTKNLRAVLAKSGIRISGATLTETLATTTPDEVRNVIYTYKSPTLNEIVYYTNQHSDNALAEATLKMVGYKKMGDQTLSSGIQTVKDHLNSSSFDVEGFNYVDGSGLSRSHAVTPLAQVKFLSSIMDKNYFKDYFDSLPIGGQTGTLKKMFQGTGYGHVFAKTGTLSKVKTLAGYIKTDSGRTLAFSLLVNNFNGSTAQVKSKMEQVLDPVIQLY